MWGYLKTLYNRMPASFNQLTFEQLPRRYSDCLASNIFYTPKIQNIAFTQQLTKYLRYLQRKDKITSTDLRSLVEAMITQYGAVHGLENHPKFKANLSYSITRNYQFKENELSPFYGRVDYMIWLNSQHFVPVIFSQQSINPIAGIAAAHATRALKSMARNDLRQSGYSIITTGQQWQMFKIYNTQRCQKTIIYEGRNRLKNIIEDYQLISAMLGLVDECLQTERQEVNVLKLAYEVIDQGKHMLQASDAQQASKAAPVSRYLRKYYQKKKENTSK